MRWLVAIGVLLAAQRAQADDTPFDLAGCAVDLAPARGSVKTLADVPSERRGPPALLSRIVQHDARSRAAVASSLKAMFPRSWSPKVAVDASGMSTELSVELDRRIAAARDIADPVMAFVRAHPCLFGIADAAALSVHLLGRGGDAATFLIDVRPRSIGAMHVTIDGLGGGRTRVTITNHLWPVADPAIAIDPKQLLARYLGRRATIETGSEYRIDPATKRHTGCVPIEKTSTTEVDDFSWRAEPILLCHDGVLEVRSGAFVWMPGQTSRGDAVLRELSTALDPRGRAFAEPWIAPMIRTPAEGDIGWDQDHCTRP